MTLFDGFALSDPGGCLDVNEDFAVAETEEGIFVVADGMGGRPEGDRASYVAGTKLLECLLALPPSGRLGALRQAFAAANAALRNLAQDNPALTGLGTTLTAAVFHGTEGRIAHVGDSRAYRYHGGQVEQLTTDHTLVAEMVARQHLSADRAVRYPLRHVLSRSLGAREEVKPDIVPVCLEPRDWLILATDGLAQALAHDRLQAMVRAAEDTPAEDLCRAIMAAALDGGAADNVTVVSARLTGANR